MDRLAAHVVATAVLTAALAAIPTAMAQPASTTSTQRDHARPKADHHGTVPLPCPDAYQVGETAYARWHGAIAFSVEQFYSPKCRTRYGFAYAWLQFRIKRVTYDLGISEYDVTHDAIDGARSFTGSAGSPYFWSYAMPVSPGTCTESLAHVFFPDNESDTFTSKFCV